MVRPLPSSHSVTFHNLAEVADLLESDFDQFRE